MPDKDALKKELEEIKQEMAGLAEDSRAYKALLAQKAEIETRLIGSGAIAQHGSTAIGAGGIGIGRDVRDSVLNTGTLYQIYLHAQTKKPGLDEKNFGRILHEYFDWVYKAYSKARLWGLDSIAATGSQKKRDLAEIFVPLQLKQFEPPRRAEIEEHARNFVGDEFAEQKAFLSLIEAQNKKGKTIATDRLLTLGSRLAVIGSPGSGKSTLLAFLAASLAARELTGSEQPFVLPEKRQTFVPLVIPLRYRREYLRLCQEDPVSKLKDIRPGTIAGFMIWYLKRRSQAIRVAEEDVAEEFFDRLLRGGGCLVMLDGLDEVVNQADRGHVKEEVEKLAEEIYPGNYFIVTARESGYKENAIFSEDFNRMDVQPLDNEQIANLVQNWCEQLYPDQVEYQKRDITEAIAAINTRYESKKLPPLIRTPLLTTMVVSVKWGDTELPRERARLYEAVVKVILQAQYLDDDPTRQELVNWGGLWDEQREWLSYLALEMHRSGQNGAAIPESRLREILKGKLSPENLDQFILAVRSRGGLFEERAELFQFAHLTFQEFLAARFLAKDRESSLPDLQKQLPDAWWREVLLLVYGFAKLDYNRFAETYLNWLSSQEGSLALAGLELAGSAVLEIERPDESLYQQQAQCLASKLTDPDTLAPAIVRARAGDTLASLGDPRFDAKFWHLPAGETLGFVRIPAGKFIMGNDAKESEKPQHEVTLPEYWIAKYPVTVAQFRAFVVAANYTGVRQEALQDPDNRPVRRISWHDGLAYSQWLQGQLLVISKQMAGKHPFWEGLSNGTLHVSLPSEAEWEKAARGMDGRVYPWGDEFDSEKVNNVEAGVGTTSAVGCFPAGASPYGVLDMSGNVWELTRSLWGKNWKEPDYRYPYEAANQARENLAADREVLRVLRGGAFNRDRYNVRCAFRVRLTPYVRFNFNGFRVVVVPA